MTIAVVLNFRTPHETVAAVRSLRASEAAISTIIVVDNASNDGSAQTVARELPGVRLMIAETNAGFSAGSNLGIREALRLGASRILLLNSDVLVPPDAIGVLERALDTDPGLGIVGPVLVSQADPERMESAGISYESWSGRMRHHGYGGQRMALGVAERRDVDAVSGCAMLIRSEVFERVGMLAEDYFFGFEDLDFCLRARAAGFRSACIGGATVLHQGGASIGCTSGRRIYFATRNHLLLARRCSRPNSRPAQWLQTTAILAFNLTHALLTSNVPRLEGVRNVARGASDYFSGKFGPGSPTLRDLRE